LTKSEMLGARDDIFTDRALSSEDLRSWMRDPRNQARLYLGRFVPLLTSGTSGERGFTVYSRDELDYFYATLTARRVLPWRPSRLVRARTMLGNLVRRGRLAVVLVYGGTTHTLGLHRAPSLRDLFVETRLFSLLEPLDRLIAQLDAFQPQAIFSYP